MVGQYTRNGYTRNFAYQIRNTVATSSLDDGRVIELNPIPRDTVNDQMTIQMKDPGIEVIKHVNGLFNKVVEEITSGIFKGGINA